ncbi:MAG: hypothetical protein ACLPUT_15745 [Solirubrobacteraceae bacterium]|jgi:hypothetical protein
MRTITANPDAAVEPAAHLMACAARLLVLGDRIALCSSRLTLVSLRRE